MTSRKANIPDFDDTEIHTVETTLEERYRNRDDIEVLQADSEVRMDQGDRELTEVPCLYWKVDKCSFVIFKTGEERYRSQFFYSVIEQYGTGIHEYDNIGDCVTMLLKMQADHEGKRALDQK